LTKVGTAMLTREIANSIVKETALKLKRNINIMNNQGVIMASCDHTRIDDIHEGALEVLKNGETLKITEGERTKWRGAQPGVNLPIVFQDKIVGVLGITGNPDDLADLGEIVKMTTELMIKQEYIYSQLEWKQRTKDMIIEELLKISPNFDNIERGLNLLNSNLTPPFITLVIQMSERTVPNQTLISRLENIIGKDHGILGFINVNRILIGFSGITYKELSRVAEEIVRNFNRFNLKFRIGISTEFDSLEKFSQSYLDCDLALTISNPKEVIIYYADIESKALIFQLNKEVAERFSKRVLHETLIKYKDTLDCFFNNDFNIQQTAEELFIHRNTLIYRLNKIVEDTGYNPRHFRDSVTLQLAMWGTEKLMRDSVESTL
jgi:carbohydrate diacid regulator